MHNLLPVYQWTPYTIFYHSTIKHHTQPSTNLPVSTIHNLLPVYQWTSYTTFYQFTGEHHTQPSTNLPVNIIHNLLPIYRWAPYTTFYQSTSEHHTQPFTNLPANTIHNLLLIYQWTPCTTFYQSTREHHTQVLHHFTELSHNSQCKLRKFITVLPICCSLQRRWFFFKVSANGTCFVIVPSFCNRTWDKFSGKLTRLRVFHANIPTEHNYSVYWINLD